MDTLSEISGIIKRVEEAVRHFSCGKPVLIGDDGKRENEIDIVFHANFATKELVNLAITHAKGLLCVALDHEIADNLGFYTAPRFPGGVSHTNFTLTVDAAENITSGISAQDRAYTIKLMASQTATSKDFLTPGHVFPLRAVEGGLFQRAGHTEALYELCKLSNLPCAGAMCEVLDELGDPISPMSLNKNHVFSPFPIITTVDLLWYKIFIQNQLSVQFNYIKEEEKYYIPSNNEHLLNLPCSIQFFTQKFNPESVRIVFNQGNKVTDNGVEKNNCCLEIVLFAFENIMQELPESMLDFCDLSAKIGLQNTKISVKRLITLYHTLQFCIEKYNTTFSQLNVKRIQFPVQSDSQFLVTLAELLGV